MAALDPDRRRPPFPAWFSCQVDQIHAFLDDRDDSSDEDLSIDDDPDIGRAVYDAAQAACEAAADGITNPAKAANEYLSLLINGMGGRTSICNLAKLLPGLVPASVGHQLAIAAAHVQAGDMDLELPDVYAGVCRSVRADLETIGSCRDLDPNAGLAASRISVPGAAPELQVDALDRLLAHVMALSRPSRRWRGELWAVSIATANTLYGPTDVIAGDVAGRLFALGLRSVPEHDVALSLCWLAACPDSYRVFADRVRAFLELEFGYEGGPIGS